MLYSYVVSKMSSRNQRLSIFSPTPSSTSFFSTAFCLHFGIVFYTRASLVAQMVKNQPARQETWIQLVG